MDAARPIADYGFLSDRRSAALVSSVGSVDWWCVPRIDSGSCFARLLDPEAGHLSLTPHAKADASRRYLPGTLVLETTFRSRAGECTVTDLLAVSPDGTPDGEGHLIRLIDGVRGAMRLTLDVCPRFDYGDVRPWVRRRAADQFWLMGGDDAIVVWSDIEMDAREDHRLAGEVTVRAGQQFGLSLRFVRPHALEDDDVAVDRDSLASLRDQTTDWWERWVGRTGAQPSPADGLAQSAVVLGGLANGLTGAIAAAATTSLPEAPGGERNWDYRYSWVRDSTLAARALAELGFESEADDFRKFIQRSAAGHVDDLQVAYGVEGERRLGETTLDALTGYKGARPVRVGNDAATQIQNDVLGELMLLAFRWHRRGHAPDDDMWRFLRDLADAAAERWDEPDSGIWEMRDNREHFVHSKVMCWAALNCGVTLADECMRRAPVRRWRKAREDIRRAVERRGFDRRRGTFVRSFGSKEVDAALLLLPHSDFVSADDERMVGTVNAIWEDLGEGGLIRRYRADDGLPGREGVFLPASFWLAECLAGQGRTEEARQVFEAAVATANDLGLYSEEYDPRSARMLGNFPQALTHLSHIAAGAALRESSSA